MQRFRIFTLIHKDSLTIPFQATDLGDWRLGADTVALVLGVLNAISAILMNGPVPDAELTHHASTTEVAQASPDLARPICQTFVSQPLRLLSCTSADTPVREAAGAT